MDTEGDIGFYFEVDLNYPANIHHKTSDFPLAPEAAQVTVDMLSEYMKHLYHNIMTQRKETTTSTNNAAHDPMQKLTRFKSSFTFTQSK